MVASVINWDTLAIVTGELARATSSHLDPDQGGGAGVIHHAREVKLIDPEQQGALHRIALQDVRSCHEPNICTGIISTKSTPLNQKEPEVYFGFDIFRKFYL